ncbi:Peptidyl-prolyl cis-trans isomerase [Spironucleus salmonicida]|uniref:Peptidyl-prolyl cis-trans isomerase n=1 Tax=Spironucleus salmonicida TaxID=348837 RepID=V6LMI2_9EUKA|nr:Peptidyl-prolyl cis-trans isomerase [Spironucleus salmonicida]KAH0571984.1 Peptidyl-prolyl cis-trans isomerase [Spironucleus salmonicida]|eukprot:EST44916.1 Peptidyl-prolyl cis-trans isomerase [Spironucleus salmonicida]
MNLAIDKICYLDISINNASPQRTRIGLHAEGYPLSTSNFYELCQSKKYQNCKFFRSLPGVCVQSGDFVYNSGAGGYSIHGCRFNDEGMPLKPFATSIAMANSGPDSNGSQFLIFTGEAYWLAGKHVVFGRILDGIEIIREIEKSGVDEEGNVIGECIIVDCGCEN